MRTIGICTSSRSEKHLMEAIVKECNSGKYDLEATLVYVPTMGDIHMLFRKGLDVGNYDLFVVPTDRSEMVYMASRLYHSNKAFIHYLCGSISYSHTHDDINRFLISLMANFCFAESPEAAENLKRVGIPEDRILVTGTSHFDGITNYDIEANKPKDAPEGEFELFLCNPLTMVKEPYPKPPPFDPFIVEIAPNEDDYDNVRQAKRYPRLEFLWLLKHCKRFASNSSSVVYEVPYLNKFCGANIEIIKLNQRNAERTPIDPMYCKGASKIIAEFCESVDLTWLKTPKRYPYMPAGKLLELPK